MGWADGAKKSVEPPLDPDLLPCPFCGAPGQIEPWHGGPKTKKLISCSDDDCAVSPGVTGDTRLEALSRWNQRSGECLCFVLYLSPDFRGQLQRRPSPRVILHDGRCPQWTPVPAPRPKKARKE